MPIKIKVPTSPDCPTIIAGDFDCHLGNLGGSKSSDPPTVVTSCGKIWLTFTPCMFHLCVKWPWAYTTVAQHQLLLITFWETLLLSSCLTLNDHPFNTSDHLSITLKSDLSFSYLSQPLLNFFLHWSANLWKKLLSPQSLLSKLVPINTLTSRTLFSQLSTGKAGWHTENGRLLALLKVGTIPVPLHP